ncbi:MAG: hypothetical protein IJR99_05280 [Kiritimatiellae bacterium]|nr:hypothetical protein [Kiritimatiellia bacterium]
MTASELQKLFDDQHRAYTVIRLIGKGGFGSVWLIQQQVFDNLLKVVKVLEKPDVNSGNSADAALWKRDVDGITVYANSNITYQNLIKIQDVQNVDSCFFYCMDAADNVSGVGAPAAYAPDTLPNRLKNSAGGRLSIEQIRELADHILNGLGELHKNGLAHRDIKPENILFVNGIPTITDMGCVAKLNQTNYTGFTVGYLPSLQTGETYNPIDHDLFATGMVLYECWTGKSYNCFPDVPTELLTDPREKALNKLLNRACSNSQKDRFGTVSEFRNALNDVCPSPAHPTLIRPIPVKRKRTWLSSWWVRGAILLFAAVCVLGALNFWRGRPFYSTPAMGLLGSTDTGSYGDSRLSVEGGDAVWNVDARTRLACCLFTYRTVKLPPEVTIEFDVMSSIARFDWNFAFYPAELGATMGLMSLFEKENLGTETSMQTLHVRNSRVVLASLFANQKRSDCTVVNPAFRLSASGTKWNHVRVSRRYGETRQTFRTTVCLDGIPIATWEEPSRNNTRFSFSCQVGSVGNIRFSNLRMTRGAAGLGF